MFAYAYPFHYIRQTRYLLQHSVKQYLEPASVAQMDTRPTGDQVAGSTPPGRQHFLVEIDYEIFSTVSRMLISTVWSGSSQGPL